MKNIHCQALPDGSGVEIRFEGEAMLFATMLPINLGDDFINAVKTEFSKAKSVHAALNPVPTAPITKRNGKGKR